MIESHKHIASRYAKKWIASYFTVRVPHFDTMDPLMMGANESAEAQCKAVFVDYIESANGMKPRAQTGPLLDLVEG